MAIDLDSPTLELARRHATADNIDYVLGDFLTHYFKSTSFDAIVSVAALHHMDTAAALERMRELLRPGGTSPSSVSGVRSIQLTLRLTSLG